MKNPNDIPEGWTGHPENQQCCVTETPALGGTSTPINRPEGEGWWASSMQVIERFNGSKEARFYVVQWVRIIIPPKEGS